ncbi:MAG: FlgD immunoglobulin-like domain containing protein [candidate division WOR-3 bacterium]
MIDFILLFLFSQPPSNGIFGAKIKGIEVQEFEPTHLQKFIQFTTTTSGEWVILQAVASLSGGGTATGDILASKVKGLQINETSQLPENEYFSGFNTSGPDANGFYTLSAITNLGNSYDILRTKLKLTEINNYAVSGYHIRRFYTSGPDTDGFVWLLVDIDQVGIKERAGKELEETKIKIYNDLTKIAPNPASDFTRIYYSLSEKAHVKIYVYDKKGSIVKKIKDEEQNKGIYRIFWGLEDNNGLLVPSGEYFIKMEIGNKFKKTKKITIIR